MLKWIKNKIADVKLSLIVSWIDKTPHKHEILNLAVRKLFCATTERDILREEDKKLFYKEKELTENDIKLLKVEATNFQNTKLWQTIMTEIEWQANKRIFEVSKTENDLIAGKIALFNLEVIKSVLNKIKNH